MNKRIPTVLLYRPSSPSAGDLLVSEEEIRKYGVHRVQVFAEGYIPVKGNAFRVAPLPVVAGSIIENVFYAGKIWRYGVNVGQQEWYLRSGPDHALIGMDRIAGFDLDGHRYLTCTQSAAIDPRTPVPPVSGFPTPDDPESPADGHAGTEDAAS